MSYVGSVAGFFVIYLLPIATYLVKLKNDSDSPLLAQAYDLNNQYQNMKLYQTKIEPQKQNENEKYIYKELDKVNDD